ncbi:MAG: GNAT family N-acetyltransferase [Anaerolineales bacterium]|nr:GNAT family N-acetyltransferase [Anaerolineales bacterium]
MSTELSLDPVRVANAPALPGLVFRRFRGADDFPAMMRVLSASEIADGNERVITLEEIANTYAHLTNSDPDRDVLMAEVAGQLVAYGRVDHYREDSGARLFNHFAFIDPAWRRKGIGAAMLGWFQARLRAVAAEQPVDGPRFFQAFVSDRAAGTETLLKASGYTAVRYGYLMVRPDLENIPDFPLPAGLEVRPVQPEHYRPIWDANNEAFRDHWGFAEPTEADYQAWLNDPTVFTPALWQIAWDTATHQVAGQVKGFINHHENASFNRKRGWCEFISVRRPWRKQGLARALITRTLRVFKEQGMTESALGVDTQNLSGALRVYEACGFRPVQGSVTYRKPL